MTNGKCEYQSILLWRVFAFDNHRLPSVCKIIKTIKTLLVSMMVISSSQKMQTAKKNMLTLSVL